MHTAPRTPCKTPQNSARADVPNPENPASSRTPTAWEKYAEPNRTADRNICANRPTRPRPPPLSLHRDPWNSPFGCSGPGAGPRVRVRLLWCSCRVPARLRALAFGAPSGAGRGWARWRVPLSGRLLGAAHSHGGRVALRVVHRRVSERAPVLGPRLVCAWWLWGCRRRPSLVASGGPGAGSRDCGDAHDASPDVPVSASHRPAIHGTRTRQQKTATGVPPAGEESGPGVMNGAIRAATSSTPRTSEPHPRGRRNEQRSGGRHGRRNAERQHDEQRGRTNSTTRGRLDDGGPSASEGHTDNNTGTSTPGATHSAARAPARAGTRTTNREAGSRRTGTRRTRRTAPREAHCTTMSAKRPSASEALK